MLTKTSLFTDSYLLRVKAAIGRAIGKAHRHSNFLGVGQADVYSRKGRYSLLIVARKGGTWEAFDSQDHDVTAVVMTALRLFHVQRRLDRLLAQRRAEMSPTGRSLERMELDYVAHVIESTATRQSGKPCMFGFDDKAARLAQGYKSGPDSLLAALSSDLYAPGPHFCPDYTPLEERAAALLKGSRS